MIALMMELVVMKMKLIEMVISGLEHTLLTLMKIYLDDVIIAFGDV